MSSKSGKKNLTKEEELLLQDFSRNVSTKSSALFYGNALIVSAIPMCKLYFSGQTIATSQLSLSGWGTNIIIPYLYRYTYVWHTISTSRKKENQLWSDHPETWKRPEVGPSGCVSKTVCLTTSYIHLAHRYQSKTLRNVSMVWFHLPGCGSFIDSGTSQAPAKSALSIVLQEYMLNNNVYFTCCMYINLNSKKSWKKK